MLLQRTDANQFTDTAVPNFNPDSIAS